jgi:hypothetical protein
MSTLTIAIPTLNRAALVGRAVASALAQTRADVEVLVSNNGSTDDTRRLLDAVDDPRVRVVHHERTMPPMVHGAYVTRQVRTPFAVFLSDDDHLEPAFAERTLARYERDPRLALVHTAVHFVHPGGSFVSAAHPELMDGWELLLRFLQGGHGPSHCATVYRADDARACTAGVPDDVRVGDLFLWPQLAVRGRVGFVPEPLCNYTWHGGNMSTAIPLATWARDLGLARAQWERSAERAGLAAGAREALRAAADRHAARSGLAHLWLRAQSGAGKRELLRDLAAHRALVAAQPARAAVRVLAMLALPGGALRAMRRARLAAAPG